MAVLVVFLGESFWAELAWKWFLAGVRPLMDGHGGWFLGNKAALVAEKGLLVPTGYIISGSHNFVLLNFLHLFADWRFHWGFRLTIFLTKFNCEAFRLFSRSWNIQCPEYLCNFLLSLKFWNLLGVLSLILNHDKFVRSLLIFRNLNLLRLILL